MMRCLELAFWALFAVCLLAPPSHALERDRIKALQENFMRRPEATPVANWRENSKCGPWHGIKLGPANIRPILAAHAKWVSDVRFREDSKYQDLLEDERSHPARANFCKANLSGADLRDANLSGANVTRANLSGAKLWSTKLSGAYLIGIDLSGAELSSANLSRANLFGADLSGANLRGANLAGAGLARANLTGAGLARADLRGADLSGADLRRATLDETELKGAKVTKVNLTEAKYQPVSAPSQAYLSGLTGLSTVRFGRGEPSGLVLLRAALQKAGLRDLEREATFALERGKTKHALGGHGDEAEYDKNGNLTKKDKGAVVEGALRLVFFEWTTGYGLHYGRAILILLGLIGIMTLIYIPAVAMPGRAGKRSGIFRIWPKGRIEETGESFEAANDEKVERLNAKGLPVLGYALYFSLLSAFQIGWRELNVGSWLTRLQSREYALRGRGWVRVVSGIQSLVSVYLVAMWVLTYFGRPFE